MSITVSLIEVANEGLEEERGENRMSSTDPGKMSWEWIPRRSIGGLRFERSIDLSSLPFKCSEVKASDDDEPWSTFEVEGDKSRFSVQDGRLISFECKSSCIYLGRELVGINEEELSAVFAGLLVTKDEWGYGKKIVCDDLDAIFWIEDCVVESISMS